MLNKKEFLKYASRLAFPIMIQNLIGTLVNMADTVMLGYVSQTGSLDVFTPQISTLFNAIIRILLIVFVFTTKMILSWQTVYSFPTKIKKVLLLDSSSYFRLFEP